LLETSPISPVLSRIAPTLPHHQAARVAPVGAVAAAPVLVPVLAVLAPVREAVDNKVKVFRCNALFPNIVHQCVAPDQDWLINVAPFTEA
jgi:hypothetical protein